MKLRRAAVADFALLGNAVIWGSTFVLMKVMLRSISAILLLGIRFSLATAALLVFFRLRGASLAAVLPGGAPAARRPPHWSAGILIGALLFSGYVFQTQGLRFTSAPKSAFLTGLSSAMVPLLAALVYRIRPQVSEVVGVLVATAGLGLMTLPCWTCKGAIGTIGRGDLLTLIGAIGYAAHIVALGHFSEHMSFEFLSVMQVGSAGILSLACCWWMETPHAEWRPVVVCGILVTGFLATALAFTVQAWAQQFTTSTRTALIYMLEPVFAWATSYLLVGESLTRRAAVGAALILGGVLLVEMKPLHPRLHPSQ
ncbi:MAG TPA: DMT family transporter [Verrucomicrobiae bacterium]|nr:DMT family transporter [Verrucomicrobiae bacterium]